MTRDDQGMSENQAVFEEQAQSLMAQMRVLIAERVPQKGNTGYECQHVLIINALNELQMAVGSLEDQDFVPDRDWAGVNKEAGFDFAGAPAAESVDHGYI